MTALLPECSLCWDYRYVSSSLTLKYLLWEVSNIRKGRKIEEGTLWSYHSVWLSLYVHPSLVPKQLGISGTLGLECSLSRL